MGSLNKCIFSGRICSEVETRRTSDGTAVTNYRLAVDRRFKREGTPTADFINIVTWGNNAEFAAKYFRKGMRVELVCRVQTRDYTTNDGRKVYVTEFVADEQGFGEPKSDGAGEQKQTTPAYGSPYVPQYNDADIPPVTPTVGGFEEMAADDDLPF
jgi:single-strand DNA-binding protein